MSQGTLPIQDHADRPELDKFLVECKDTTGWLFSVSHSVLASSPPHSMLD